MFTGKLVKQDFVSRIGDIIDVPEDSFVLRITDETSQTAMYRGMTDDGCLLLSNVIELKSNLFIASDGVVRPERFGELYLMDSFYCEDIYSEQALDTVINWSLFQNTPRMQRRMLSFVKEAFAPMYVLYLKRTDQMHRLFVPVQQRFRIGRYALKPRWEDANLAKFKTQLETLVREKHITYVGHLPESLTDTPVFFTAGNYSHLETDRIFHDEPCLYRANCGGNIKLAREDESAKCFVVDAGASYKGNGVNASREEASVVAGYLKELFPDYVFVPASGRGAVGTGYSF
ncbi:MAG: hypothetical protein ACOC2H_00625 [Spirochaetota bacterium]